MDLVFDDKAVARSVGDEIVGRLQRDTVDVGPERGHQVGSSQDDARPAQVVENLVDGVVGDDVEKMLAIDVVAQGAPD